MAPSRPPKPPTRTSTSLRHAQSGRSGHSIAELCHKSPAWPAKPAGRGIQPPAFALLKFIPQKTPTRTYTDLENRKCQSNLTDLPRFFGYFPWSLLAGPHRERTHYSPCLTFISLHPSNGHDDDITTHSIDHLID